MNFFKKLNHQNEEAEDLDTGYTESYFQPSRRSQKTDAPETRPGTYNEPEYRPAREERRADRYDTRNAEPYPPRREPEVYEDAPDNNPPRRTQTVQTFDEPDYVPSRRDVRDVRDERDIRDPRFERDTRYTRDARPGNGIGEDDFHASSRPVRPVRPAPVVTPEPEPVPVPVQPKNAGTLFFRPADHAEYREAIVRGLMESHIVVVSVEDLQREAVTRLFDYIMGALYVLEADMSRFDKTHVVLSPKGVAFDPAEIEIPAPDDDDFSEDRDTDTDAEDDGFSLDTSFEDGEESEYEDEDEDGDEDGDVEVEEY